MKKTNYKFRRALASILAFVMVMLSTSLLTTISVLAEDGGITYLAPVYDTDGNKIKEVITHSDGDKRITDYTYDTDGNVIKEMHTRIYNGNTTTTTTEYSGYRVFYRPKKK